MTTVLTLVLVALALLGTPLFVVVGSTAMLSFASEHVDTQNAIVELYRLSANPFLLTIPMFTFTGFLMARAGTPRRLARLARAILGWLPGGLVIAVILSCSFFTTISGASGVTIIALGGLFLPILAAENYPERFRYGIATAAGSMGLLLPPALPLIVYGMVSGVEINKIFIAGILPGLVTMGSLAVYGMWVARRAGTRRAPFSARELALALWETKWELLIPVIIVVGLFGGIVTVAEVSAITAAYVLFIEVFIYKDLQIRRDLSKVMRESMMLVGAIIVVLGCALGLSNYMVDAEVPMKLFAVAQEVFTNKWTFLIALNFFLLIVGGFLDIFSAIMVVVPLITPVAKEVGIDPIHLAIIFIANLQIGYLLPPAGIDLCVASLAFRQPMVRMYRVAIPFVLVLVVALLLITYIPWLSLGLLPSAPAS